MANQLLSYRMGRSGRDEEDMSRAAVREADVYKRALVALDGSPVAEAILPIIKEIAGPLDMEVVLLRVVVPIPPQVVEGSRHAVFEDVEERLAEARHYLTSLAAGLAARGVRIRVEVRRGDPVREIVAAAAE